MSFLYPNVIAVHRPNAVSPVTATPPSVRTLPYRGVLKTNETVILSGVTASVQFDSTSTKRDNHLPADTEKPGIWKIFIPAWAAARGAIQNRDIIIDENGQRYMVDNAYPHPLGHTLKCRLLEV